MRRRTEHAVLDLDRAKVTRADTEECKLAVRLVGLHRLASLLRLA